MTSCGPVSLSPKQIALYNPVSKTFASLPASSGPTLIESVTALLPISDDEVWVGTVNTTAVPGGVWKYRFSTATWSLVGGGLTPTVILNDPVRAVTGFALDSATSRVYVTGLGITSGVQGDVFSPAVIAWDLANERWIPMNSWVPGSGGIPNITVQDESVTINLPFIASAPTLFQGQLFVCQYADISYYLVLYRNANPLAAVPVWTAVPFLGLSGRTGSIYSMLVSSYDSSLYVGVQWNANVNTTSPLYRLASPGGTVTPVNMSIAKSSNSYSVQARSLVEKGEYLYVGGVWTATTSSYGNNIAAVAGYNRVTKKTQTVLSGTWASNKRVDAMARVPGTDNYAAVGSYGTMPGSVVFNGFGMVALPGTDLPPPQPVIPVDTTNPWANTTTTVPQVGLTVKVQRPSASAAAPRDYNSTEVATAALAVLCDVASIAGVPADYVRITNLTSYGAAFGFPTRYDIQPSSFAVNNATAATCAQLAVSNGQSSGSGIGRRLQSINSPYAAIEASVALFLSSTAARASIPANDDAVTVIAARLAAASSGNNAATFSILTNVWASLNNIAPAQLGSPSAYVLFSSLQSYLSVMGAGPVAAPVDNAPVLAGVVGGLFGLMLMIALVAYAVLSRPGLVASYPGHTKLNGGAKQA